jgi:glycosyl transferase family 2
MTAPAATAILIVNGFDRGSRWGPHDPADALRFPWISLCLRQIERHTDPGDVRVLVYDQSKLPEHAEILREHRVEVFTDPEGRHMPHADALDLLVDRAEGAEFIVTLDSDAFPVSDAWLEQLTGSLRNGAALAGIYRDEMAPDIRPFIHVSGLCIRRETLLGLDVSFARDKGQDTGQNITDALTAKGAELNPLPRSNRRNFHFLIGGVYGDVLYHHGAGSRHAKFWTSTDVEADERVRVTLRDAAFEDVDHLLAVLRGTRENDLGLPEVPAG